MKKIVRMVLMWFLALGFTTILAGATSADEEAQYVADEVVAAVSSLEEAEMVATYYGITLDSYAYGIAVYTTSNPETTIRQSQTFSLMPVLYQNRIYTLFESDELDVSVQYHHSEIRTTSAWEYATGEGVSVAIIDTGVDIDHEALTHAISETKSYNAYTQEYGLDSVDDDHGHGTHVAGIVAAYSEDEGIYGVAPDADLMIIKSNISNSDDFTVASLVRAINYAVEYKADIINMSLGASYTAGAYDLEQDAVDNAVAAGVTVICAAGNFKEDHAGYPAAYDSAIAVSAVSEGFSFASSYSNYGPEIDIAAPGTSIYSTYYNGGYTYKSGTSMACPVVAGVAALILSANPDEDYTPEEIRTILRATSMEAGDLGWDSYYGAGIVNAYSAVLGTENLFEVSYYDGNTLLATTYVAPGDSLITPTAPSGDYEFSGWTTNLYGAETWDFSTPITENLTLYAEWDIPEGVYHTYDDESSTVIIAFSPKITMESGQIILALYENGQMHVTIIEDYENAELIRIAATCQGNPDEAKIFMLDVFGKPLSQTTIYTL